jgi:hypothetical protein
MIRERIVDDVDVRIGEQLGIRAVGFRDIQRGGSGAGGLERA